MYCARTCTVHTYDHLHPSPSLSLSRVTGLDQAGLDLDLVIMQLPITYLCSYYTEPSLIEPNSVAYFRPGRSHPKKKKACECFFWRRGKRGHYCS
jgi:hypothetical protein